MEAGSGKKQRLSLVEVMQEKAATKATLTDGLSKSGGKDFLAAKIKHALSKVPASKVSSLESSPKSILTALDANRQAIKSMIDQVESKKSNELAKFKEQADEQISALDDTLDQASEINEGLQYLMADFSRQERLEANQVQYERVKLRGKMVHGGFGLECAKIVAPFVAAAAPARLAVNPTEFTPQTPTLWQSTEGVQSDVVERIAAIVAKGLEAYNQKQKSLEQAMTKNPKWGGCLARLEMSLEGLDVAVPGLAPEHMAHEGAQAWLVCCQSWSWRFGPIRFPLARVRVYWLPCQGCITNPFAVASRRGHSRQWNCSP